jgi:hypothetical protein
MLCSGYDHESNGRTKIIKLDPLVNIRNESVFFKYPKLEIDLVDYNTITDNHKSQI